MHNFRKKQKKEKVANLPKITSKALIIPCVSVTPLYYTLIGVKIDKK